MGELSVFKFCGSFACLLIILFEFSATPAAPLVEKKGQDQNKLEGTKQICNYFFMLQLKMA